MSNNLSRGTFNGLGTFNMGVPEIGTYVLQGNISLPTISGGSSANSQVVVTITLNSGSALYTGPIGAQGFYLSAPVASANSTFNITLSSSAPVDQGLNVIKTNITISEST